MLPNHFISVNEIPLTPNGKKNRASLLTKYRNRLYQRLDFTAPRTPTESRLLTLWKKCLQVDFDIGMYENFTSMGGDSLKGLELLTEVENEFNVLFPAGYFESISTIWRMAAMLNELSWASSYAKEQDTDPFTSSRIYKGLRDTTAGWKGDRVNQDSLIVSIGDVKADYQVYLCLQTYELANMRTCELLFRSHSPPAQIYRSQNSSSHPALRMPDVLVPFPYRYFYSAAALKCRRTACQTA